MSEQHQFQTETSRLLDIVANALYSEREIFLRELISNASDACDRLRYELKLSNNADFRVEVVMDANARTLTIRDNGIGMSKDELMKNLGTIAHSGTRQAVMEKADMSLIGQFGVGFYSAFMVADRVEVLSRRTDQEKAYLWVSDGRGSYTLDEHLKDARGTEITLHLKDNAGEFLLEEKLKQIIQKYSDHIGVPIALNGVVVNKASALWMRPKNEITPEQYKEFYTHVSGAMAIDAPWLTLHWRAEGVAEYTNLLFIPGMKPFDLYDPRRHHGVKLYVKRVFIADGVEGLIPPFLRFVKGVVDSEDLPLNISREMLQASPAVGKMSSAITRKILSELADAAEKNPESFAQFWALFGAVVKEGLYDAHAHREALLKVVRFRSTATDKLVSLEEYAARMKPDQQHVYYLSGVEAESAKNSPQLEAFRAEGIEVLLMTDTIDEFWLPVQQDYKGKTFKSVTRGDAALSKQKEIPIAETEELIARLREILADEVKDVQLSDRLVESPVCLVAPENDVDIRMQRILKKSQGYEGKHRFILEINAKHPLIEKMKLMAANEELKDTALLLLDQARILEGEPLKDPAAFVKRMSSAIARGLN